MAFRRALGKANDYASGRTLAEYEKTLWQAQGAGAKTVEIGQAQIKDHQVGAFVNGARGHFLNRGQCGADRQDGMSGIGESVSESTTYGGVVLHEEHEGHPRTVTD